MKTHRAKTILLVDDEQIIRQLVRAILEGPDYELVEATDGAAALDMAHQWAERGELDLVVLDWMMPHYSGIEVARVLRNDPVTADTPIIMLTAKADRRARAEGEEAGVVAFLVKPFSPLELLEKVEEALKG